MYIVGIDIAKRKHEAAVIDGDGAVIIKPFSFTNNCSGYNRLLAMLTKAKLPLDEVSFAMEATGHYWLALFTRLQKEGFRVQVINPVQTNSIRSFYIRQAKTDPRDALLIAEVIRFGHFSESTLHPENIYELRELCRGRHAIVSMQADVKRKVVALLDQVFPEYETAFTNMFSDTSMAILQTCPTPKELSEMPLEELCHLIEVSSHKRFRMAKAQELQALARNSFGFAMAGDVFSTMIRLYAKHLDFLKQQVREMDRKIAEIMDTLDTPITTITGIGLALLNDPKLLVLDEPVNGLDPLGIQELRALIRSFPQKGITVIISSHILSEIQQTADYIGIIAKGTVGFEGKLQEQQDLEALFMKVVAKGGNES